MEEVHVLIANRAIIRRDVQLERKVGRCRFAESLRIEEIAPAPYSLSQSGGCAEDVAVNENGQLEPFAIDYAGQQSPDYAAVDRYPAVPGGQNLLRMH